MTEILNLKSYMIFEVIETITARKIIKGIKFIAEIILLFFLAVILAIILFIPAWIIIIIKLIKIYRIKKEMRIHAAFNLAVHETWNDFIFNSIP